VLLIINYLRRYGPVCLDRCHTRFSADSGFLLVYLKLAILAQRIGYAVLSIFDALGRNSQQAPEETAGDQAVHRNEEVAKPIAAVPPETEQRSEPTEIPVVEKSSSVLEMPVPRSRP
jgi:hypothetical protein